MGQKTDVIVVGGGVIGVCTAYYLAKGGRAITLIEKDAICSGGSYGNAGLITPSHAMPIAAPGVIKQGLKWMVREDSPLLFRPKLDARLIAWLIRFASKCREEAVDHALPLLRDLSRASLELFKQLIAAEGLSFQYDQQGLLTVYTTEQGFAKGRREATFLANYGLRPQILDDKQAHRLEPALSEDIVGAVYHEEDAHGDCRQFVLQLAEVSRRRGVNILSNTSVSRIIPNRHGGVRVQTGRGEFTGESVVISAGSWTLRLAKDMGIRIPLQPAKGYSITVERPAVSPRIPVLNAARKVIATPLGDRLRFAGTMEFAGFDLRLNPTRTDAVLRAGLEVIAHNGSLRKLEQWCGLRPCTPDGLPIIGRLGNSPAVFIATGHAMLGYTLGPITGKLVSEVIAGCESSIDTTGLRIERF